MSSFQTERSRGISIGAANLICRSVSVLLILAFTAAGNLCRAQAADANQDNGPQPIAIVPIEDSNQGQAKLSGALQVTHGTAFILKNGTITSGNQTTNVILPRRGVLHVCSSTSVTLSADSSVPAGEQAGLMMAMEHGAIEANYAAGKNADVLITPDLRIMIAGPGAVQVNVRLSENGDTCVDNKAGDNAPYVLVSSVFDAGAYRVQPGQRVMFQHGSLQDVVDQEKEPCGCPAAARPGTNDFPENESAGLAPLTLTKPVSEPAPAAPSATPPEMNRALVYPHNADTEEPASAPGTPAAIAPKAAPATAADPAKAPQPKKKRNFIQHIGHFLKSIFTD